jgi:hypothetical protein
VRGVGCEEMWWCLCNILRQAMFMHLLNISRLSLLAVLKCAVLKCLVLCCAVLCCIALY